MINNLAFTFSSNDDFSKLLHLHRNKILAIANRHLKMAYIDEQSDKHK